MSLKLPWYVWVTHSDKKKLWRLYVFLILLRRKGCNSMKSFNMDIPHSQCLISSLHYFFCLLTNQQVSIQKLRFCLEPMFLQQSLDCNVLWVCQALLANRLLSNNQFFFLCVIICTYYYLSSRQIFESPTQTQSMRTPQSLVGYIFQVIFLDLDIGSFF